MATEKQLARAIARAKRAEQRASKLAKKGSADKEKRRALDIAENEAKKVSLELQIQLNDLLDKKTDTLESNLARQEKISDKLQTQVELQGEINKAQELGNTLMDGFANKLGISASMSRGLFKSVSDTFTTIKEAHEKEGKNATAAMFLAANDMAQAFTKSVWDALHPLNIMESLMGAIWKASAELFFRTSAEVAKFNAVVGDLDGSAKSLGRAMDLSLGVNIQHASRAAQGLGSSFTEFTSLTLPLQTRLVRTSAALERIGISAQDTGDAMNYFTKAAGWSLPQAEKQMKKLAVSAAEFGKTPGQFASEFLSASKVLAAHGPNMVKVFLDLESVAKASGIAMDSLLSIATKFDTFDTAASSVGNLNALLGGDYLNTLEMMNMTEKERIEAVKMALEMNGRSFDQMERFERKAIAESMGTDEATLAQMMGYSTRESRKARREAEAKMRQEKAYQKMIRQTIDIAESIQFMFQSLFAKTGVMNAFGKAFNVLFEQLKPENPLGKTIRVITDALGDLMAYVIEIGTHWLVEFIGTGEEITDTMLDWTEAIRDWFLETKGQEPGGILVQWKKKFQAGIADFTAFVLGPVFNPVRKAMSDMIIKPMMGALDAMAANMKKNRKSGFMGISGDVTDAMIGVVQGARHGLKTFDKAIEKDMVDPIKDGISEVEGPKGVDSKSPSKKFIAIGKSITDGFNQGMDPDQMNEAIKLLVRSTDAWAKALKKVAKAAEEVGESMSGGEGAGASPGALNAGNRIVLELDGHKLAEYILDVTGGEITVQGRRTLT